MLSKVKQAARKILGRYGYSVPIDIEAIVKAGIPVQGHVGVCPMRLAQMGGFQVTHPGRAAGLVYFKTNVLDLQSPVLVNVKYNNTDLGNNKRGFIFKQGRRYPAIKVWPQSKGHFFGSFDQGDSAPGSYDDMLAAIEGAKQI